MADQGDRPQGSLFDQRSWQISGNVYNVAGDLILSKDATKDDFIKALEQIRLDVGKIQAIPADAREEITSDLDAVARQGNRDEPSKDLVVGRLNTIKATLETLKDSAEGALGLAQTVGRLAVWAGSFFL